jgi:hypothetical protein
MPKHRKQIAVQVTKSLYATEASIDSALAQIALFVSELPAARQDAQFGACIGQAALTNAIAAMNAVNEARQAMIAAHQALSEVSDRFHLTPVSFGVPKNIPPMGSAVHLRAVEAA